MPPTQPAPKLLDRVRAAVRARHYSRRTEVAYVAWVRRFILFHRKTHPARLGASDVAGFLTWLAVDQAVSASTQNEPGQPFGHDWLFPAPWMAARLRG